MNGFISVKDIKFVLFAAALLFALWYVFGGEDDDALEKYIIEENQRVQVERDSARALADREHSLRMNLKSEYEIKLKEYDVYSDKITDAVEHNDVHVLDSIGAALKRRRPPRFD